MQFVENNFHVNFPIYRYSERFVYDSEDIDTQEMDEGFEKLDGEFYWKELYSVVIEELEWIDFRVRISEYRSRASLIFVRQQNQEAERLTKLSRPLLAA